jgi:hypothetical protein
MLKTFLATTAIASLAALGVYAQENPDAASHEDSTLEEPMAPANTPEAETGDEPILPEAETAQEPAAPMPEAPGGAEEGAAPMQAQEATPPPAGGEPPLEEGYSEVDVTTLSADDLIGTAIQTHDDQSVANISDVILSDQGQVENVVAEFGGFLGFGARTVLLTMDDIDVLQDPNGNLVVRTDLTPEALETRPDYEG